MTHICLWGLFHKGITEKLKGSLSVSRKVILAENLDWIQRGKTDSQWAMLFLFLMTYVLLRHKQRVSCSGFVSSLPLIPPMVEYVLKLEANMICPAFVLFRESVTAMRKIIKKHLITTKHSHCLCEKGEHNGDQLNWIHIYI